MTILPENVLMISQVETPITPNSLLRMTGFNDAYTLDYTDGEDFNMDLNM